MFTKLEVIMDEIVVDPKLFVTCRLCLEDLGQYQIVPSIKQQIKYCFDIEVEPFDGLPQLICLKCKEILNKFHTIKNTFCEKQTNLLSKAIKKEEINKNNPLEDTVSSSEIASENINGGVRTNKPKKKRFLQLSSSSDIESEKNVHSRPKKKKRSKHRINCNMSWAEKYKLEFCCKLCNSAWSSKTSFWNHFRSHDQLRAKYSKIFNRECLVNLNKIDDKPNLTGMSNMVVHSNNKVIVHTGYCYYASYTKDTKTAEDDSDSGDKTETERYEKNNSSRRSTDEEEIVAKPTHRKRRILSRSSNETVVIESNSNNILSDNEEESKVPFNHIEPISSELCINIDSSDSETEQEKNESNQRFKQPIEARLGDYKVIQGIISMCVNSYNKKSDSADVDMLYMNVSQNSKKDDIGKISSESQLKHKVLSIGRKIINKKGFNCTGLLRYMEHKNLEIAWMTKPQTSFSNKETNYIRILTKLRGSGNKDDNTGWENVSQKRSESKSKGATPVGSSVQDAAANQFLKSNSSHEVNSQESSNSETLRALLYYDSAASNATDSKKLLNANPVANPKKLPKKLNAQQNMCNSSEDGMNFCLPIITATTSLAPVSNKEQNENDNNNVTSETVAKEKSAPRIKVKPVSELMSERTLNNLMKEQTVPVPNSNMLVSQIENVWPHQHPVTVYVPSITVPQMHVPSPQLQLVPAVNIPASFQVIPSVTNSTGKQDAVVLDTTDLPNTITDSPFKYLKDLLQIHNICLLDPCNPLSPEFICLIKFKVVFKQEITTNEQPVVLCLSISCLKNSFSLQVRDRNQKLIDINEISASWQWEILQIYRGEVTIKVLQNAQRTSRETFDFTNKFVCLLKSIKCDKPKS